MRFGAPTTSGWSRSSTRSIRPMYSGAPLAWAMSVGGSAMTGASARLGEGITAESAGKSWAEAYSTARYRDGSFSNLRRRCTPITQYLRRRVDYIYI